MASLPIAKSVRPFLSRSSPREKLMPKPLSSVLTLRALMTWPASEKKTRLYSHLAERSTLGRDGNWQHGCQMAKAGFLESYVFGPSGFWTMAPLRCAAKFDPFLSLDCARVEGVGRNPRKGRDQILQRSVAEP